MRWIPAYIPGHRGAGGRGANRIAGFDPGCPGAFLCGAKVGITGIIRIEVEGVNRGQAVGAFTPLRIAYVQDHRVCATIPAADFTTHSLRWFPHPACIQHQGTVIGIQVGVQCRNG